MKKKFGGYTINAKKLSTITREDGLIETKTLLTGDIEIGIYIETMTWRADWLAEFMFGKEEARKYRLVNVENNFTGCSDTENKVIAVWDTWNKLSW